LPAGHAYFVRIVSAAIASSAGVPDSNQNNLRALRVFAVHLFFSGTIFIPNRPLQASLSELRPDKSLKAPRTQSKFTGLGAWLRQPSIPQRLLRKQSFSALQHQLSEGHEHFVRIVPPVSALSAGVPDSNQNNLRALRAFAVQSFKFFNLLTFILCPLAFKRVYPIRTKTLRALRVFAVHLFFSGLILLHRQTTNHNRQTPLTKDIIF